jgi:lysophospholipase L1-like esterase
MGEPKGMQVLKAEKKRDTWNWEFNIFLVFILLSCFITQARAQTIIDTSSHCYPWLCPQYNFIQYYDKNVLKDFSRKWNSNKNSVISIAHFGDSHVQPDIYTGALRKRLQICKGNAGFGIFFPFSTAKTYGMIDYKSDYTGTWDNSKSVEHRPTLPLGITGITSRTTDSNASFRIIFRDHLSPDYRKLKIFCKQDHDSYAMKISTAGHEMLVMVDSIDPRSFTPYIEITLPTIGDSISVQLVKNQPYQNEFEIYGLSLEKVNASGVLLHCMGIGGSQYASLLWEDLFDYQLPGINPDLAILDFGTNDIAVKNNIPDDLEFQIVEVIKKIRRDAPDCTILLTSTMDMKHGGRIITASADFSKLIRKIAKEQKCPFYDWYWVSGGPKVMKLWKENDLAQPDMVHLKSKGYVLKGELFSDAFIGTMALLGTGKAPDSLIFPVPETKESIDSTAETNEEKVTKPVEEKYVSRGGFIMYKVKPGENLGSIAVKFHTTISALQKLNRMKNEKIFAGKSIKVPGKTKKLVKTKVMKKRKHHRR